MHSHTQKQNAALLDLHQAAESEGIPVWLYGGYGLDALEGTTVREHKDIDICVEYSDQPRLREALPRAGLEITETGDHYTMLTGSGQGVEALTFQRRQDGRLVTDTGETGVFPWPDGSFPAEPNGFLLGRPVRAMSYEGLYVCKAGYSCYDPNQPLREKDKADLELIASRIPPARLAELKAFFDPIPGTRKRYPNQDR